MAVMIPETIADSTHASPAEKHVFEFLRDALMPDEEFRVWYEPRLGHKVPDFIIYAKSHGLLVLEVKGYNADKLVQLDPKKFVVRRDGREESEDSPLEQAEKAYRDLMDSIKARVELCHRDGPHKGKPLIPISYCASFPNIPLATANKYYITSVVTPTQCLFAEDFQGDPSDPTVQRHLRSKLRPIFAQRVQFKFEGLNPQQERALRSALSPEVKLTLSPHVEMATLDVAQERVAKSIGDGHRILKGVVGSGKSVVVAARAKYLARCNPHWKILVLCYNVPLTNSLRYLVHNNLPTSDAERISVMHYHGLVRLVTGAKLWRDEKKSFEEWEATLTQMLSRRAPSSQGNHFDAILIDEGQDFDEDMVKAIAKLLNPQTNSLLFCYDPAQNVFGRKSPTWKRIGINVQGKRPTLLTQCYRSTVEIVTLATKFMGFNQQKSDEFDSPLFPQTTQCHGKTPHLTKLEGDNQVIDHLLRGIRHYVLSAGYDWGDIGIIYAAKGEDFVLTLQRLFVAQFGVEATDKFVWINQDKHAFDASSSSIKICGIESCKGLEFKIVFLVGLEHLPRDKRQQESEKRLAYVGLTRAQNILHIVYERESEYIRMLRDFL